MRRNQHLRDWRLLMLGMMTI
ncbi:hypothetical protein CJF30_00008255 [Rutstroemia sp. NJR-2017a BBW]|nr:hypothetical protein CJF30_00008255 [Rutstroemia sp. NJR-2017a BBW]